MIPPSGLETPLPTYINRLFPETVEGVPVARGCEVVAVTGACLTARAG